MPGELGQTQPQLSRHAERSLTLITEQTQDRRVRWSRNLLTSATRKQHRLRMPSHHRPVPGVNSAASTHWLFDADRPRTLDSSL